MTIFKRYMKLILDAGKGIHNAMKRAQKFSNQFFANVYLNGFDNFCKRELKCKKYIRYVDDFIIFDDSKENLVHIKGKIQEYLRNNLKLQLRDTTILRKMSSGLDFLGHIKHANSLNLKKIVGETDENNPFNYDRL